MPKVLDVPTRPRHSRTAFIVAAILGTLFLVGERFLSFFVDALWFGSLGYTAVFWKTLTLQWLPFVVFFPLTFGLLFGAFSLLRGTRASTTSIVRSVFVNGQPLTIDIGRWLKPAVLTLSGLVAWVSASVMSSERATFTLWIYGARTAGVADPIFGKPLNFYLLALPAWQVLANWFWCWLC